MGRMAIICIDDESSILDSLKIEFKKSLGDDYLIEIAESSEEALDVIDELREDGYEIPLVVCDYIMPGMKGDELLRRIHAISPSTLKIMLTGQADIDAVSNVVNYANLYRYIPKPWDSTDLSLTIKEALHSYFQTKKLEQFYANLEKKIAQRTQELNKKNEILTTLNKEKDEFLSIAAHDLKNPLFAIQGLASLIESDFDDMSKAQILEFVSMIRLSSKQMFEITKNLLDVNMLEENKIKPNFERADIVPIVQLLIKEYGERAKQKNIHLEMECEEDVYLACIDKHMVYQILDNLISNAIKYSFHNKLITIQLSYQDSTVQCAVKDEGPGLSKEDQNKLFGKFTRLTPQPTGDEHSTGLGLFIVKKLVTTINGRIWCNSEIGKGTTFTIALQRRCENL